MNKKEAARERARIQREQSLEHEALMYPHRKRRPQPRFGRIQDDFSVILVAEPILEKPSRLQRILHRKPKIV